MLNLKWRKAAGALGVVGLAAAVSMVGCERTEFEPLRMPERSESVAPQPVVAPGAEQALAPAGPVAEALPVGPRLTRGGWPGRDGRHTFGLTWLGGDAAVELRTQPSDTADLVATVKWTDGTAMDWRDTRLVVGLPQIYRASEAVRLPGSPYEMADDLVMDEAVTVSVEPGELLWVYGDAGDAQCYVANQQAIFVVECGRLGQGLVRVQPVEVVNPEQPWEPGERQWWVLVESKRLRGWWRVDESLVEVRTVPLGD